MNNAVGGTYQNGHIILQCPVDWPEGIKVEVTVLEAGGPNVGMTEEEWKTDPDSIAQWLRWYDSLEPLEFSGQEQADLADWRQKVKEYDIAKSTKRLETLAK